MKRQAHKHKESFSILLISNTGRSNKQYHVSLLAVRLLIFVLLLICVVIGWLAYQVSQADRKEKDLRQQLNSIEQTVNQLEEEKENLNNEKLTLTAENEALRRAAEETAAESQEEENEEETDTAIEEDPTFPSRFPSSGSGILISTYSEEQPYLSINTHSEGSIIAAGDGTVVSVSTDDTYAHIIEVEHESGYKTRYMCREEAELLLEEGDQVKAGDTILNITTDNTQLDYQVIYGDELVDPLTIIEAKG